jgi:hypothetical protein
MDESGHSGPNSFDLNQPVFVSGGWIIARRDEAKCRAIVAGARDLRPNRAELSSASLFRSADGRNFAIALLGLLLQEGASPVICVAEKRLCVAVRIVETVLSPFESPQIAALLPIEANVDRRAVAERIAQLPIAALKEYVDAWDAMDEPLVRCAIERLAHCADLGGEWGVAELLRVGVQTLDRSLCADGATFPLEERTMARAVNPVAFGAALNMACERVAASPEQPLDVIHDETEFEEVYREAAEIQRDAGARERLWFLQDGTVRTLAFGGVGTFDTVASELEPLVQAADVLVGFAMRLLRPLPKNLPAEELAELRAAFFGERRVVNTTFYASAATAIAIGATPPSAVW